MMTIKGKVLFNDLGIGAWGIQEASGEIYRIVNMPVQLKVVDAHVQCLIETIDEEASIHMWGTPAKIISFFTRIATETG